MPLCTIHTVRHGFRQSWITSPHDGSISYPGGASTTITGIPADVSLTAHGETQAQELASYIASLPPSVRPQRVYCSPWYRCIQTCKPVVDSLRKGGDDQLGVLLHPNLGEWFAPTQFEHPRPLAPESMGKFFPNYIDVRASQSAIASSPGPQTRSPIPSSYRPEDSTRGGKPEVLGETIAMLHDRVALALENIIRDCDQDNISTILICSHAATLIAIGRALTGRLGDLKPPEDLEPDSTPAPSDQDLRWQAQDFRVFTCSLSTFERVNTSLPANHQSIGTMPGRGLHGTAPMQPMWWSGQGVCGGWRCVRNGETSFLRDGAERGW